MMNLTTPAREPMSGSRLVASVRRVVTKLLDEEWPRAYEDGLRVLVRQLIELEHEETNGVDAALVEKLLPVLDALERARAQALTQEGRWAARFDKALENLVQILAASGVRPDRPLGAEFDPTVHEAVDVLETERLPSGRIVRILERGWFLENTQIRPSKVVVSKRSQAA